MELDWLDGGTDAVGTGEGSWFWKDRGMSESFRPLVPPCGLELSAEIRWQLGGLTSKPKEKTE